MMSIIPKNHRCLSKKIKLVWLVVFNVPSTARSFRDGTPIYCPLRKDVKLDKYTIPTGNRTPGRRMAVHYVTAEPRKSQGTGMSFDPFSTPESLQQLHQHFHKLINILSLMTKLVVHKLKNCINRTTIGAFV